MSNTLITLAPHLPAFKTYIPLKHQNWVDLERVQTLGMPCGDSSDTPVYVNSLSDDTVVELRQALDQAIAHDYINLPTHLKMAWLEASRRFTLLDTLDSRETLIDSTLLYLNELQSVDVSELIYEQTDLLYTLMPKINIQALTERIMGIYMDVNKLMMDSDLYLSTPAAAEAALYQIGLLDVDPIDFINRLIIHLVFSPHP